VWPISVQCRVLEVSVAGCHEHFVRRASAAQRRHLSDDALLVHIKAIHAETHGGCGWPLTWKELLARGIRAVGQGLSVAPSGEHVAIGGQRLDIGGFVEHPLCAEGQSVVAQSRHGVIGQHHSVQRAVGLLQRAQHVQPRSAAQNDADNGTVAGRRLAL